MFCCYWQCLQQQFSPSSNACWQFLQHHSFKYFTTGDNISTNIVLIVFQCCSQSLQQHSSKCAPVLLAMSQATKISLFFPCKTVLSVQMHAADNVSSTTVLTVPLLLTMSPTTKFSLGSNACWQCLQHHSIQCFTAADNIFSTIVFTVFPFC